MNCSEVQNSLSAYHDGELSPDLTAEVAGHLADCSSCSAELVSFSKLSHMSRRLTDPPVPTQMWGELETKLRGGAERTAILAWLDKNHGRRQFVAVAAAILIVAAIGAISYQSWFAEVGHDHLAVNFAGYLDEFDNAQKRHNRFCWQTTMGGPRLCRKLPLSWAMSRS